MPVFLEEMKQNLFFIMSFIKVVKSDRLSHTIKVGAKDYSTEEVGKLLAIQGRKIRYWVETGIISPKFPSLGRGVPYRFSNKNIVQCYFVECLRNSGHDLRHISRILTDLTNGGYFEYLQDRRIKRPIWMVVTEVDSLLLDHYPEVEDTISSKIHTIINLPQLERCVKTLIDGGMKKP